MNQLPVIPRREDDAEVERRKAMVVRGISPGGLISRWPIEAAVLMRSGGLWLVARLALGALLLLTRVDPVLLHPKASLVFAGAVGILSWLDTRRRNEDLLLANLGTSRRTIFLLQFGSALGLECLVAVIGRL